MIAKRAGLVIALALAAACTRASPSLVAPEKPPSDRAGHPAAPKVVEGFAQSPQTNDWWSSLIWAFDGNPYSRPMFPHPLAVQAEAEGLGVSYPSEPKIDPRGYRFPYARDLRLGVAGLRAPDARVAKYSDWAVTAQWKDGAKKLEATFGHGLPFVYARVQGGDARVALSEDATPWSAKGEVVGVTVHGHTYGLFAPSGATWRHEGGALVSDLAGKGFFSIAVLPDATPATLDRFRKHAYAFVDDTRATWTYAPKEAKLVTRFEAHATLVEPGADRSSEPIVALYPHQWKASNATFTGAAYVSPRGAMKVVDAGAFDVTRAFHGVLPVLPDTESAHDRARSYLKDEAGNPLFKPGLDGNEDSYWDGKSFGRAATMAWIARQVGEDGVEERLREAIAARLGDWFDGKAPRHFVYDAKWRTLIGYPSGYQSWTELNDHHFHYGYFLWAAATIAALDPKGPASSWTTQVRALIDDVASARDDGRFPRLRYFDAYAGHSWASGPAMFDSGNNEESSSEDANFAAGLILWGIATHDDEARDRGIFLYETLVSAIEQYWLDVDGDVFPKGYRHPVAGIVWGDGARYDTWWTREPTYVHGINMLPITGASLYLGRRPEVIAKNRAHLAQEKGGPPHAWRDVLWMDDALDDAELATRAVDDEHYFDPEFGGSWAATYAWVLGLRDLGRVDTSVLADAPSYAVFRGPRGRTYAAYNASDAPLHVAFTDGATLDVPPRALAHVTRAVK